MNAMQLTDIIALVGLPLLIFIARIFDVSIGTLRIIFLNKGYGSIAPILGFFEVLIWIVVIAQVMQNADSWIHYLAYAGGFAAGTYVGMRIEQRLAIGTNLIQVITKKEASHLIRALRKRRVRTASVRGIGNDGPINILYITTARRTLEPLFATIKKYNPNAFITVEGVRIVDALASGKTPISKRFRFRKTNKTK